MTVPLICLGCGGVVDEGGGLPEGATPCSCPPPAEARHVRCPKCGGTLRVGARACPFCHTTLATRRCGACAAWNLADAQRCQACGRPAVQEGEGGKASGQACPRCSGALLARLYGELDVEECDACGGLWLAPETMDRVVASRDAPTNLRLALPAREGRRQEEVRYLPCPVCDKHMNRQVFGRFSGVVVDVCRSHGVWFDVGELTEVLSFIERGGLERARDRQAEDLKQAARDATAAQTAASFASFRQRDSLATMQYGHSSAAFLQGLIDLWL